MACRGKALSLEVLGKTKSQFSTAVSLNWTAVRRGKRRGVGAIGGGAEEIPNMKARKAKTEY